MVLPALVEGRDMRTDRPDTTESAYSVEVGLVRGEVLVSATAGHELTETSGFFVEAVGEGDVTVRG